MKQIKPSYKLKQWLKDGKPEDGWQLKDNAPEWVVKEYENFMKRIDEETEKSVIIF